VRADSGFCRGFATKGPCHLVRRRRARRMGYSCATLRN
jgi:hypothetical protein